MMELEFLQNGITLRQERFRLGIDAVLLADFAAPPKNALVCDLCAGAGAVGLLLLSRRPDCRVTALELREEACAVARRNVADNGLEARMTVVQGDLREASSLPAPGRFDCVCCNPPYYPVGAGRAAASEAQAAARTEKYCTLRDVCIAAARLLKTGGSLYLVHRAERLAEVLCALREQRLEPKTLRLVRHESGKDASLVLVRAVLGGGPGLVCRPDLVLRGADGSESAEYKRIYHL